MESVIALLTLLMIGSLGLVVLYQTIKYWKFIVSCLLMPFAGMLAMSLFLEASHFNDTVHPLLLGMAGVCIGCLMGDLLTLRKNWR